MRNHDERILRFLRQDGRMNLTTISRKTGIPVSTIFDRLRSHEGTLIRKFTAILDFNQLGYAIRANIMVRARPDSRAQLRAYLESHPQVNSLWRIDNGFDYVADCVFRGLKEIEEFMEHLELKHGVQDKQVFHIIDEVFTEKVLTE